MSKTAYFHGNIITAAPDNRVADGLFVRDGRILAVGGREEILSLADGDTELIDLEGKTMLPGFIDRSSAHRG